LSMEVRSVMHLQDGRRFAMTDLSPQDFIWIRSKRELESCVAHWRLLPFIGIDTEFERSATFHAKPGLIQLADTDRVYLIDPLEVSSLESLGAVLASPDVAVVMHAMSEDITLLRQATRSEPQAVFDTQIAAAMLGYGASLGYQNLVEKVLGVELDKGETRSDWLQRPLTDSQIDYAVKDTAYLVPLYHELSSGLKARGLYHAVLEESDRLMGQSLDATKYPEKGYLKLRGAWDLTKEGQQRLQALVSWRDQLAQEKDVPKPWVFTDQQLIGIAQRPPRSMGELSRLNGLKPKSVRLYGEAMMGVLEDFIVQDDDAFEIVERPIRGAELDVYKRLKKIVQSVESKTGIAAQLLGSRKMLEALVISRLRHGNNGLGPDFSGWRAGLMGERLEAELQVAAEKEYD